MPQISKLKKEKSTFHWTISFKFSEFKGNNFKIDSTQVNDPLKPVRRTHKVSRLYETMPPRAKVYRYMTPRG
jgi:hypothetical protein